VITLTKTGDREHPYCPSFTDRGSLSEKKGNQVSSRRKTLRVAVQSTGGAKGNGKKKERLLPKKKEQTYLEKRPLERLNISKKSVILIRWSR